LAEETQNSNPRNKRQQGGWNRGMSIQQNWQVRHRINNHGNKVTLRLYCLQYHNKESPCQVTEINLFSHNEIRWKFPIMELSENKQEKSGIKSTLLGNDSVKKQIIFVDIS
jgi:hypothetical protein